MKNLGYAVVAIVVLIFVVMMFQNGADFTPDGMAVLGR